MKRGREWKGEKSLIRRRKKRTVWESMPVPLNSCGGARGGQTVTSLTSGGRQWIGARRNKVTGGFFEMGALIIWTCLWHNRARPGVGKPRGVPWQRRHVAGG